MRKIEEVLRLRAEGMSPRKIAVSIAAGKSTVYEYLARADAAGIGWPLPEGMDEAQVEALLFPEPSPELAARRPVPDWTKIHAELKKRHVTMRLLWLEFRGANPEAWGYSQFCAHYQRWLGVQDVVMRLSYKAGERMFVDYAGDTAGYTDPDTGQVKVAQVFVAVLGASGMLYVEATRGQDLGSWLMAHVHAFDAYRGAPELVVPDNLKSGVTKACFYEPDVNRSYLELARHYDTVVLPTRTAHPRDKAAVEAGVLTVERWVLAPLRHRQFFSLAELNSAIAEQTQKLNTRAFRGEPSSRAELFAELEAPALKALPASVYELAAWKKVRANIDYHVEFDRRFYSVPYRLVRQRLELRATATTIEVFQKGQRVASHVREYGRRRYITDPAHMPASHRAHLEWSPSKLVGWASGISTDVASVVERILEAKPHPEQGYRACLGLMSLGRRYGNERLGAACTRALACSAISYTSVKSILVGNLDRLAVPGEPPSTPPPPDHDNLRGANYYSKEVLQSC
ncbi:MAG: IS21 family transposase [Actinomycetota bacterium]